MRYCVSSRCTGYPAVMSRSNRLRSYSHADGPCAPAPQNVRLRALPRLVDDAVVEELYVLVGLLLVLLAQALQQQPQLVAAGAVERGEDDLRLELDRDDEAILRVSVCTHTSRLCLLQVLDDLGRLCLLEGLEVHGSELGQRALHVVCQLGLVALLGLAHHADALAQLGQQVALGDLGVVAALQKGIDLMSLPSTNCCSMSRMMISSTAAFDGAATRMMMRGGFSTLPSSCSFLLCVF